MFLGNKARCEITPHDTVGVFQGSERQLCKNGNSNHMSCVCGIWNRALPMWDQRPIVPILRPALELCRGLV